jgi:hypothetical protein
MKYGRAGFLFLLCAAHISTHALTPGYITAVSPPFGQPSGGQIVTISGSQFTAPVRVWFDSKEAFVVSLTNEQIVVVTPPVDLGGAPALDVPITVYARAGTPNETRTTAPVAFRIELTILQPFFTTLAPSSGPVSGGTRVTIFGDGFQAPMQVFFGSVEAQVISITFKQIVLITPQGTSDQPVVPIRILNVSSGLATTAENAFLYLTRRRAGPPHGSLPSTSVASATATRRSSGELAGRSSTSTSP